MESVSLPECHLPFCPYHPQPASSKDHDLHRACPSAGDQTIFSLLATLPSLVRKVWMWTLPLLDASLRALEMTWSAMPRLPVSLYILVHLYTSSAGRSPVDTWSGCISVSISMSICLSICMSVYLSIYIYL